MQSARREAASRRIGHPRPDPTRKLRFREAAREIVAKDRYNRKYGYAVDTAGSIARAMERAYRQGFSDAQSEAPASVQTVPDTAGSAIEWALIPPRPRTAFWSICLFALRREGGPENGAHLLPAMSKRGTPGWQLVIPDRPDWGKQIGHKTIMPLLRLGLLETADGEAERLRLSACGKATWQRFIERGGRFPEDLTII